MLRIRDVLSLAIAVGAIGCAGEDSSRPPNLLLIVSDNQSHSLLGTYGNTQVKTPNIDRLAEEGIRFNRAFAVNGVCSPTRATLLTGLIPSQTGIHVALPGVTGVSGWSAVEEFRSLPQTLSEAGYTTGLVGKYHLGEAAEPQLGFQYWVTFPSGHTTTFYDQSVIDNGEAYTVKNHLTDFWTDKAIDFISRQTDDRPFFLYLSLQRSLHVATHREHGTANPSRGPLRGAYARLRPGVGAPSLRDEVGARQGTLGLDDRRRNDGGEGHRCADEQSGGRQHRVRDDHGG